MMHALDNSNVGHEILMRSVQFLFCGMRHYSPHERRYIWLILHPAMISGEAERTQAGNQERFCKNPACQEPHCVIIIAV